VKKLPQLSYPHEVSIPQLSQVVHGKKWVAHGIQWVAHWKQWDAHGKQWDANGKQWVSNGMQWVHGHLKILYFAIEVLGKYGSYVAFNHKNWRKKWNLDGKNRKTHKNIVRIHKNNKL